VKNQRKTMIICQLIVETGLADYCQSAVWFGFGWFPFARPAKQAQ